MHNASIMHCASKFHSYLLSVVSGEKLGRYSGISGSTLSNTT